MHTLEQLQSGKLLGSSSIKISCGLTDFPLELLDITNTLEILDLSGNKLSALPDEFAKFTKLKIAFFSDNLFTEYPKVLSQCPLLEMVGFKSNQINYISEEAISKNIRWLILTNNRIKTLPKSIGHCVRLQKLALSGNQISELPEEMANCKNLELIRIAANDLKIIPKWLFFLPRLAWLAYSDNPCCFIAQTTKPLQQIYWNELEINQKLGEGASGFIYKANWKIKRKNIAVKLFKGEMTSDGLPFREMTTCAHAGKINGLVTLLGKIINHPEEKQGLVFELIPSTYKNLGNPPNYDTCTRDTFNSEIRLSVHAFQKIALEMAFTLLQLHDKGIMHGDFYAHNMMIDNEANTLLGDFGAATLYNQNTDIAELHQQIDVRAYGYLLDDLIERVFDSDKQVELFKKILLLKNECLKEEVVKRPLFKDIFHSLNSLV